MNLINITTPNGIIVRKGSLWLRNVTIEKLLETMEVDGPLDENQDIISFGPHFGQEVADEFSKRLDELGVFADYFVFSDDIPDWLKLRASFVKEK